MGELINAELTRETGRDWPFVEELLIVAVSGYPCLCNRIHENSRTEASVWEKMIFSICRMSVFVSVLLVNQPAVFSVWDRSFSRPTADLTAPFIRITNRYFLPEQIVLVFKYASVFSAFVSVQLKKNSAVFLQSKSGKKKRSIKSCVALESCWKSDRHTAAMWLEST